MWLDNFKELRQALWANVYRALFGKTVLSLDIEEFWALQVSEKGHIQAGQKP